MVAYVDGNELLYRNRDGDVVKYNVDTDEQTVLVQNKKFEMYKASRYEVSPDLKHVLLAYNVAAERAERRWWGEVITVRCDGLAHTGEGGVSGLEGRAQLSGTAAREAETQTTPSTPRGARRAADEIDGREQNVYQHSYTAFYIICSLETPCSTLVLLLMLLRRWELKVIVFVSRLSSLNFSPSVSPPTPRETWNLNPPEVRNAQLQFAGWGPQDQQLISWSLNELQRAGLQGGQNIFIFENNIYYRSKVESRSIRLVSTGKESVIFNGLSDWLYEDVWRDGCLRQEARSLGCFCLSLCLCRSLQGVNPHEGPFKAAAGGDSHAILLRYACRVLCSPAAGLVPSLHTSTRTAGDTKAPQTYDINRNLTINSALMPHCSRSVQRTGTLLYTAEEIFHSHIAHWWSPDGARLAYATINDTLVPKMELPMFTGSLYPMGKEYPYPKAGEENPVITLYVVNLNGPLHTIEMRRPDDPRIGEYYVTMVKWATTTKLAINWLNRAQNISMLTLCEATTGVCTKAVSVRRMKTGNLFFQKHEDESEGWLYRQNEEPLFSKDGLKLFFTRAIPQGGRGKFFHISMSVSQVRGISEVSKLESNENLRLTLDSVQMPTVEYREINMDDYILSLKILKPAGFMDTSHYPLLLLVYVSVKYTKYSSCHQLITFTLWCSDGTPGGQTVSERFVLDWATVLVSSFGAIVVRCDGRGSGFQGTNVLHRIHKKLGVFEEQDQTDALEFVLKEPYVDQSRVGAFGQVFGGYVTSLLLSGEESPIKCGAVLSPITDFELYASAFSERYLGLPKPDPRAYTMANLAHRASRFMDKKFLIVHPTADGTTAEKVHFQHTAKFISQLISEKANYTLQIYPDEGHFIHSDATRQHLSQSLVNFFEECFRLPESVFEEDLEEEVEDEG
ncbi:hypothetical protein CCH79_00003973 [Gambusia affinis]|uniref:A-type potassium channel modulatory protein DPP6 n=1 Tax=Gambusia affinis TaxID=33528 RepID=A0A315V4L4_GAMAF|nr:hypothetical protein CCH79_00003973 [Gambusia affinis]